MYVKTDSQNSQLIYGHFMTISNHFVAHYMKIFHKTEVQISILRWLVFLNSNWIKCNDGSYNLFFSCLMHNFRARMPKQVLTPKNISSHVFSMVIFPKFFRALMIHIFGKIQVEK